MRYAICEPADSVGVKLAFVLQYVTLRSTRSPSSLYMLHLGIDVGAQGTKVLVYDSDLGQVVARGASSYGLLPTAVEGRAEQDPATWIQVRGQGQFVIRHPCG